MRDARQYLHAVVAIGGLGGWQLAMVVCNCGSVFSCALNVIGYTLLIFVSTTHSDKLKPKKEIQFNACTHGSDV